MNEKEFDITGGIENTNLEKLAIIESKNKGTGSSTLLYGKVEEGEIIKTKGRRRSEYIRNRRSGQCGKEIVS